MIYNGEQCDLFDNDLFDNSLEFFQNEYGNFVPFLFYSEPRKVFDEIFIQSHDNINNFEWQSRLLSKFQQPQHQDDPLYYVDKICNKQQVQGFLDELICPICYEIVADPISCESCGQSFCDLCIMNWKKQSLNTCPCCREYFYKVKPSKYLNIFLNKLIFSCINEDRGCNQQSFYSDLKNYQKYCDHQIQNCPNPL